MPGTCHPARKLSGVTSLAAAFIGPAYRYPAGKRAPHPLPRTALPQRYYIAAARFHAAARDIARDMRCDTLAASAILRRRLAGGMPFPRLSYA